MVEVLRTSDQVVMSFAVALLTESGVAHHVADWVQSDGSIVEPPTRLLVALDQVGLARRVLSDNSLLD